MTPLALIVGLLNGTDDVILGVVAAVLVAFSLIVALVIPRRRPDFPGRNMKAFVLVSVLLVVAMLAAVEAFGEAHDFGAAQGEEAGETSAGDTGESATEPTETEGESESGETETGAAAPDGDPAAGEEVYASAGCGSCHTFEAAGTTATVGPDLDETLADQDAASILESIVSPDAEITEGFSPDLMPETYGEQLSDEELADLVAFLAG